LVSGLAVIGLGLMLVMAMFVMADPKRLSTVVDEFNGIVLNSLMSYGMT